MNEPSKHIDELIVKQLVGELTSDENQTLNAWLDESDENTTYLRQMERVWEQSQGLEAFRSVDVMADFAQFKMRVGMSHKGAVLRHTILRIAAVMVPALLLLAAYGLYERVPGFGKWEAFYTQDKVGNIVLADASEVALNRDSELLFEKDFRGDERRLRLKGEAYFKVAKNPDKPFIVEVGDARVKVLGTAFNIDETKELITLSVNEGRVLFIGGDQQLEVVAGEEALFSGGMMKKRSLHSDNYMAWKTGTIVFNKASLSEVLKTVQDYFDEVEFIVNNASRSTLNITSRFKNPSLDDVLVELRIHFKKKFEINDNKLIISD
ncbi:MULTISPECIES: FecR family protein [unclassified Carboxylicivirga]|uniref:FecR family protein n=1 Tax=Carboxylicivirga TaxID=1628153 RepID=UPI003D355B26